MTAPTLHTIDAKVKPLHDCSGVRYRIGKDGNVTLSVKQARCIVVKLKRCEKNVRQLETANSALNAQILMLNQFGKGE